MDGWMDGWCRIQPMSVCSEFVFLFILPGLVLVSFCLPQPSSKLFIVTPNYLVLFFIGSPCISCLYIYSLVASGPCCVLRRTYLCSWSYLVVHPMSWPGSGFPGWYVSENNKSRTYHFFHLTPGVSFSALWSYPQTAHLTLRHSQQDQAEGGEIICGSAWRAANARLKWRRSSE
ncbi:hypothetical protein CHARACLAT_003819 [Characodon lateralis]|uniref:Uncharacterized protein n=1 Tax=Characodon lateralis TaxID=208331 RepID=A0ABU7DQ41_9TELE|nr:hypothetical protein [Characodon lateralis]